MRRLGGGGLGLVASFALVAAIVLSTSSAAAAPSCSLVPVLRDVTVNQGLGSYPNLVRGKEALVRVHVSLPSCAARGNSIQLTGGSLRVSNGSATLATVSSPTPTPTTTFPTMPTYTAAAALDSPGDAKFVVPGSALAPLSTTSAFTATFRATIGYQSKTSSTATPVSRSVSFSTLPGTTTPITKPVARRSNALRVLVVPMGNAALSFDSQFTASGRTAVQNGIQTLARMLPVPDGLTDLTATSGGLRYSINPGLLGVGSLMSGGKFCGTAGNFNTLKPLLAQFLQSWNTANPATPADRVLGVVDAAISNGGSAGCAEGMASVSSPEAWVRAIPDGTSPSMTGALMAMELAHTFGVVPRSRADGAYHSIYAAADGTAPNRGYNLALRSFLADDRTVMTLSSGWNNANTLLERDDFADIHCALGGPTTSSCGTAGAVGVAAAAPGFVLSGTTDGTPAGTKVLASYFATGVARTPNQGASEYKLVYLAGGTVLEQHDVAVHFGETSHHEQEGSYNQDYAAEAGLFSVALPFNTDATRAELRKGGVVLYARDRTAAPIVNSVVVSSGGGGSDPGADETTRVSVSSDRAQGDDHSGRFGGQVALSANGRYVAFVSEATNLVVGDTNAEMDVFVRDLTTGVTERVSVSSDEIQANASSGGGPPAISEDGRYVGFHSGATNLVSGDTNGTYDVFVRDRVEGVTERVSLTSSGGQADNATFVSGMSSDGRFVVLYNFNDSNLVAGDANGYGDVLLRDRQAGTTTLVSVSSAGTQANAASNGGAASSDGRFVVFQSSATNLVDDTDANGAMDVFVRDVVAGTTELVSRSSTGGTGNSYSGTASLSADGRFVAFQSRASDIAGSDTNNSDDVFVRDRQTGSVERVSVADGGAQGNDYSGASFGQSLSSSGRYVTFFSFSTNLVNGDTNTTDDVFLRDRVEGRTQRVSVTNAGAETNPYGGSFNPVLSGDGRIVAFASDATNLVADDTNGRTDVFARLLGVEVPPPPAETETVTATVADDNPQDNRLDLFLRCASVRHPVVVAAVPSSTTASAARFNVSYDQAFACAGGTLEAVVYDGFLRSAPSSGGQATLDSTSKSPAAAVYGPPAGSAWLQYSHLPLVGGGFDPEDGVLSGARLEWALTGPGVSRTGTGQKVDLSPPPGGWAPGSYTVTLTATDASGASSTATSSFTVLADADNDGLHAGIDPGPNCSGSGDSDPLNAYDDPDGDGIASVDDRFTAGGVCTPAPAAAVVAATARLTPNPVPLSKESRLVVEVRVPAEHDLRQIVAGSVRITSVGQFDVSQNPDFLATGWTVGADGVGYATFDWKKLVAFYSQNRNQIGTTFTYTIAGRSSLPAWRFSGSERISVK